MHSSGQRCGDADPNSVDETILSHQAPPTWIGNREIVGGLRRAAVRGWVVTAGGQAAKFLVTLGSTAVMARILSPGDYGLVAMVTVFVGFVAIFKDLGLSQATVQRPRITQQQVSGMFWLNVAMGLLIMLAMAAVAPVVSHFYGQPELTGICLAYAAMAPISALGAQHDALLRRSMQYRGLAIRDLVAVVLGAGAGITCALRGFGYWSLVVMQGTTAVAGVLVLWWQSGWRPGLPPRWTDDLRPMIRFGGALTLSNLLGFVSTGLDSIVVGSLFGPTALGLYNRAQHTLSRPLKQVLPPIMNVAGSAFARVARDQGRFEAAALQLAFMIACLSSLVVAVAVVFADWIVLIMLGPQWREAVPMTRVLALFAVVEPIASMLGMLMTARGLPGKLVRWRVISTGVIVTSLVIGLSWGPLGVAAAYSLSGLFIRTPLFVWYATRHLDISPVRFFLAICVPLVSGGVTAAILTLIRHEVTSTTHAVASLLLYGSVATVIHLGLLFSFQSGRARLRVAVKLVQDGLLGGRAVPV